MNAKQRRKLKRFRIKNKIFNVGDEVRVHHKHKDVTDTLKPRIVTRCKWDDKTEDVVYFTDNENIMFTKNDIVPNTKESRRSI